MLFRIRLVALLVIALGAFALDAPPAHASVSGACCTSGDGKYTCCGETCTADAQNCSARCSLAALDQCT